MIARHLAEVGRPCSDARQARSVIRGIMTQPNLLRCRSCSSPQPRPVSGSPESPVGTRAVALRADVAFAAGFGAVARVHPTGFALPPSRHRRRFGRRRSAHSAGPSPAGLHRGLSVVPLSRPRRCFSPSKTTPAQPSQVCGAITTTSRTPSPRSHDARRSVGAPQTLPSTRRPSRRVADWNALSLPNTCRAV
jgi:hypothetical protein